MRTAILPPTNPRHPSAATHVETRPVGSADGRTSRASYVFRLLLQNEVLLTGNVEMTAAQWSAYPAGGTADTDAAYENACVLTNLGLTAA